MREGIKNLLFIIALATIPVFLVWLPFFLRLSEFWNIPLPPQGMATIVANYDGPLYIVVAKTFYNIEAIKTNYQFPLPAEYYSSHFPLFPLLIRLFSYPLGFPYAMLFVTVTSSILCLYYFHKLTNSYWLTFVFSILPARFLVVRSIGSPEPLFLAAIIASVFYFTKKKYWLSGIFGAMAVATKSPGILLFVAYFLYLVGPKIKDLVTKKLTNVLASVEWKTFPIFLMPLSLLSVFVLYKFIFNDFFAYFHSGDNIHLLLLPFQIFNYSAPWVGTFWLEETIFIYLFGALGLISLIKQKQNLLACVYGVFFATIIFVSHRDLLRYSLPMLPFFYVAFSKYLETKEFKIVLTFLIIPIYLFSLAFISQNVMPISDWRPFL
ncbi:MAG: hypothetical protein AAB656_04890 [Patescibacteria group bacterium]